MGGGSKERVCVVACLRVCVFLQFFFLLFLCICVLGRPFFSIEGERKPSFFGGMWRHMWSPFRGHVFDGCG